MPNSTTARNPQVKLLDTTPAPAPEPDAATAPARKPQERRKRLFLILGAVVLAGAIGTAVWFWITAGQITTDNAYVDADVAQVTPLYGGPVAAAFVSNTDIVKKGQLLVTLDGADAQIALAEAQAQLGQVERKVRGYFANDAALGSEVVSRDADIAHATAQRQSAAADYKRARVDLARRQALSSSGAVSAEELTQAQNSFSAAEAALAGAKAAQAQAIAQKTTAIGQRSVNSALIEGTSAAANPEVQAARAKLQQAELNVARTRITAPIDGVIAKNAVQVGQQVQPGQTLMTIVPIEAVYVNANYKEAQLRNVRIGEPAELTSDLYGSAVKYRGKVVGIGGGTGAAFALIPAQNATGNWIKVVQRLPVRIALDPAELRAHPLRVGLSMNAVIDASRR
ncbi:MAG TPA: HlyD family efflux transporter periplasmic adaptor subunit [Steroidobacteraceae bacterium]